MDLAIHGGMSPEDIISFVEQHTEKYSELIKAEMQQAQDRTDLMQDLANLASSLERCKATGDDNTKESNMQKFGDAHKAIEAFLTKHPEFEPELKGMSESTALWSTNHSMVDGKKKEGVGTESANADMDKTIHDLTNRKDKIAGDDKIGMMTLQDDASRMKELYELGSNLLAKGDQVGNVLISNIKG